MPKRGIGARITWGHPQKGIKKYTHGLFNETPELSKEDRMRIIAEKMRPYDSEKALEKVNFIAVGAPFQALTPTPSPSGGNVSPTPTPTSTPTPSVGFNCIWNTQQSLWENNNNEWQDCNPLPTPTPSPSPSSSSTTPTPTPTPSSTPLPGYAEALTYMDAVLAEGGYLDASMSAATIQLFTDLNSDNSFSNLDVFYPFMGSNINAFKVNGKNPGTHNLTYSGGIAINPSGITGNDINGFADTNYNENNHAQVNNLHIGVYCRTNFDESGFDMGAVSTGVGNDSKTLLGLRDTNNVYGSVEISNITGVPAIYANTDSTGHYIISRTGSTSTTLFKNGSSVATDATVSTGEKGTRNYYILARNNAGTADLFTKRQLTFVHLGKGLTTTEASNLSTHINTFLTSLNRNTY